MPFAMNEKVRSCLAICVGAIASAGSPIAAAEPLTASQALNEAIRNNPSLRAAAADLTAARGLTSSESARYDPVLTLSLGATHSKSPSLSPGASAVLVGS